MSIEINNPKTVAEKIDAAANLVEQMMLAHKIKDETHFKVVHKKAGSFLFDALRQLEDEADVNASVSKGIDLIAKERSRQIAKGYDGEHDENETSFQLSTAAGHYIANAQNKYFEYHSHSDGEPSSRFQVREFETEEWKETWPWDDHDGRLKSDVITSLVKAGALIAAEIDRLQAIES